MFGQSRYLPIPNYCCLEIGNFIGATEIGMLSIEPFLNIEKKAIQCTFVVKRFGSHVKGGGGGGG